MWFLTSLKGDPRYIYVILSEKNIVVGRSVDAQNCDFAIPDDPSISRRHASLSITDNNLFLEDLGSRYGTFINNYNEKISSNTKIIVKSNDTIRFGKLDNIWKVNDISFITCTSTLKGENLQKLKLCLAQLGGILKSEWDETCVYLTMPAIKLTIKVVLALVQGSFIVTTDYWNKCIEAITKNLPLPEPQHYIPHVIESTLNKEVVSFLPNDKRKELFKGKMFVFFCKMQLDMYRIVLSKCSAKAILFSESNLTKSRLCEDDVIVIQYIVSNNSQETEAHKTDLDAIMNFLKSKNKRVVADAEIGLAVLYTSCDKYCNPNFNFSLEVIKDSIQSNKTANILAQETQESTIIPKQKENIIINESLCLPDSSKRKYDEVDPEKIISVNKKLATETNKVCDIDNKKRKFTNDSNESISNPSKKLATENIADDNLFNFTTSIDSNKENKSEKKLNFVKPSKRKVGNRSSEDDDLFNFIQDKKIKSDTPSQSNLDNIDIPVEDAKPKKKIVYDLDNNSILKLRGIKLKELNNIDYTSAVNIKKIKKEESTDELENQMENLDLGTTVIKVRNDLIVKKEALRVEDQNDSVRNFKKFKKVWPVKMQVSVIPQNGSKYSTTLNVTTKEVSVSG